MCSFDLDTYPPAVDIFQVELTQVQKPFHAQPIQSNHAQYRFAGVDPLRFVSQDVEHDAVEGGGDLAAPDVVFRRRHRGGFHIGGHAGDLQFQPTAVDLQLGTPSRQLQTA